MADVHVFVVSRFTTRELFETFICATLERAQESLKSLGYGFVMSGDGWESYQDVNDSTQSAMISRRILHS